MRLPSRKFRLEMKRAAGESDFLAGIQHDIELADAIRDGMQTKFGAAIFNAYEQIERACYAEMANTSPFNVMKQLKIRAELTTVLYVKAQLEGYIVNADTLLQNLNELNGETND